MKPEKMTRRHFLIPLAGLGLAGTLGLGLKWVWDRRPEVVPLRKLLDKIGPYRDIGAAYLREFPEEAETEILARHLFGDLKKRPRIGAMMSEIKRSIQRDYDRKHTFYLEGWVLSRTEGRVCALALTAEPGLSGIPMDTIRALP